MFFLCILLLSGVRGAALDGVFFVILDSFKDCLPEVYPQPTSLQDNQTVFINDLITANFSKSCMKAYTVGEDGLELEADFRGTMVRSPDRSLLVAPTFPPTRSSQYKSINSYPTNQTVRFPNSVTFFLTSNGPLSPSPSGTVSIRIRAIRPLGPAPVKTYVLVSVLVPVAGFFAVVILVTIVTAIYQRKYRRLQKALKQQEVADVQAKTKVAIFAENKGKDAQSRFSFRGNRARPQFNRLPSHPSSVRSSIFTEPDNAVHHDHGYGLFDHMAQTSQPTEDEHTTYTGNSNSPRHATQSDQVTPKSHRTSHMAQSSRMAQTVQLTHHDPFVQSNRPTIQLIQASHDSRSPGLLYERQNHRISLVSSERDQPTLIMLGNIRAPEEEQVFPELEQLSQEHNHTEQIPTNRITHSGLGLPCDSDTRLGEINDGYLDETNVELELTEGVYENMRADQPPLEAQRTDWDLPARSEISIVSNDSSDDGFGRFYESANFQQLPKYNNPKVVHGGSKRQDRSTDLKDQGQPELRYQGQPDLRDQGQTDLRGQGQTDFRDQGQIDLRDQGQTELRYQSKLEQPSVCEEGSQRQGADGTDGADRAEGYNHWNESRADLEPSAAHTRYLTTNPRMTESVSSSQDCVEHLRIGENAFRSPSMPRVGMISIEDVNSISKKLARSTPDMSATARRVISHDIGEIQLADKGDNNNADLELMHRSIPEDVMNAQEQNNMSEYLMDGNLTPEPSNSFNLNSDPSNSFNLTPDPNNSFNLTSDPSNSFTLNGERENLSSDNHETLDEQIVRLSWRPTDESSLSNASAKVGYGRQENSRQEIHRQESTGFSPSGPDYSPSGSGFLPSGLQETPYRNGTDMIFLVEPGRQGGVHGDLKCDTQV